MEVLRHKHDVWGREVLLGVSWDLLWLILIAAFLFIAIHSLIMASRRRPRPGSSGPRLERHRPIDRWFHWVLAATVLVLIGTGVVPILGLRISWLTWHWVAGVLLTAIVLFHIIQSLFWRDPAQMLPSARELRDPLQKVHKPGKYSLAQKGLHAAMAFFGLVVIASGAYLMSNIRTPFWPRTNWLTEQVLGWLFVSHGLATLGLVGLICLHIYFGLRPEKRFYTRSMLRGWISQEEFQSEHDPELWKPERHED